MVGFGFSVGDFIASISLISSLIKSLEEGAGSSAAYQELITELYVLENALMLVKRLELDATSSTKPIVERAVLNCQKTITRFLEKNRKFAPRLRKGGSSSAWRDALRKVQWALYREEDVRKLRAEINAHTGSINTLLMVHQTEAHQNYSRHIIEQQQLGNVHSTCLAEIQKKLEAIDSKSSHATALCPRRGQMPKTISLRHRGTAQISGRLRTNHALSNSEATDQGNSSIIESSIPVATGKTTPELGIESPFTRHNRDVDTNNEEEYSEPMTTQSTRSLIGDKISSKASRLRKHILNQNWKFLGAWLSLIAYHEERYGDPQSGPVLNYLQAETTVEINLLSRMLTRQLRLSWNTYLSLGSLSISLETPMVIWEGEDSIKDVLWNGNRSEMIELFQTNKLHPNAMFSDGFTLLWCASAGRNKETYEFLIQNGARSDASWSLSDAIAALFAVFTGPNVFLDRINDIQIQEFSSVFQGQLFDHEVQLASAIFGKHDPVSQSIIDNRKKFCSMYKSFICHQVELNIQITFRHFLIRLETLLEYNDEITHWLEWFLIQGASPFIGTKNYCSASLVAYKCGGLGTWYKVLCKNGYDPQAVAVDAFISFVCRFCRSPTLEAFCKDFRLIIFTLCALAFPIDDYPEILERIGSEDFSKLQGRLKIEEIALVIGFMRGLDENHFMQSPKHFWDAGLILDVLLGRNTGATVSGTDFDPPTVARFKALEDGADLRKRKGKSFEDG